MRRIVMFNWLTVDGYFAGPDGKLEWVVPDEEQAKAAARDIPGFGRATSCFAMRARTRVVQRAEITLRRVESGPEWSRRLLRESPE